MAYYQNGVLSRPTADAGESEGLLQWPGETDFSGGVGSQEPSLVPELSADTPAYWQAFGPGLGIPESTYDSGATPQRRAPRAGGISIPWLLIGGLAIAMYALRR